MAGEWRWYVGEVGCNPAPLEWSLNECSMACRYCFAQNNGRNDDGKKRNLTADPTIKHITSVMRTSGNPRSMRDILTLRKYPVCVSNGTDPAGIRNANETLKLFSILNGFGIPVQMQTRGTRKPADFVPFIDLLPPGSILYMSITGWGEDFVKDVDLGCPTSETRLEMAAMAAERGIPVVAAINPVDQDWCPDPEAYCARIEELAGKDTVKGVWVEPLHFTRQQAQRVREHPRGLPVLMEGAFERASATPWALDPFWGQDLVSAIKSRWPKWFSHALPEECLDSTNGSLFDLWPKPHFPTYHRLVQACHEVSVANGRAPVLVPFSVFCSWLDPYREVLDIELSRGDAWTFINQRNDAGKENRLHLPSSLTLEECLKFLWLNPTSTAQIPWGMYGLKSVAATLADGDVDLLRNVDLFREDDDTPVAVFAPNTMRKSYITDPKDRYRLLSEIQDRAMLLAPFDPEDDYEEAAPASAGG